MVQGTSQLIKTSFIPENNKPFSFMLKNYKLIKGK